MTDAALAALWKALAPADGTPAFHPVRREEDGTLYEGVWQVTVGGDRYFLKRAKEYEAEYTVLFLRRTVRMRPNFSAVRRARTANISCLIVPLKSIH